MQLRTARESFRVLTGPVHSECIMNQGKHLHETRLAGKLEILKYAGSLKIIPNKYTVMLRQLSITIQMLNSPR